MFKHRVPVMVLLLCLLLCSCSTAPAPENSPSGSGAGLSESKAPQTSAASPSPALNGEPFKLVVSCDVTVSGSGNKDGFYQIIENADGSRNAVFTDYQSCQQIYLCADANCRHNTEQCSSWFAAGDAQVWPIACDDQIFYVHNSWSSASYIEKANLDGSNRQTLCQLQDGTTIDSGAAYKSGYLVLMVDTLAKQGDAVDHAKQLIALDTDSGESTVLFESVLAEGQAADTGDVTCFFQGVTAHGFIVERIEIGASPDLQFHTVYLLPFDGSDVYEIASFQTGEMQGLPHGDSWYYLAIDADAQQLQLGYVDSATGETHIVVPDLEKTIPATSLGDVFIRNFVDDWIIINALTSMSFDESQNIELKYRCYAVNPTTGELRELTLSNYYHATLVPIEIFAELGDHLLVQACVDEIVPDQPEKAMTELEETLAIISKDAYLTSDPDYQMIHML